MAGPSVHDFEAVPRRGDPSASPHEREPGTEPDASGRLEDAPEKSSAPDRILGWQCRRGVLDIDLGASLAAISIDDEGSVRIQAALGPRLPAEADRSLGREPWQPVEAEVHTESDGEVMLVRRGRGNGARVQVFSTPLRIRVLDGSGALVAELDGLELRPEGSGRIAMVSARREGVFGLGGARDALDRRGEKRWLHNRAASGRRGSESLSVPFLLTHCADGMAPSRGVFLDSFAPCLFDLAGSDPERLAMETQTDGIDLTIFQGPGPAEVIRRFTRRVGRAPLPPRWSLGHLLSGSPYRSARAVRRLADALRRRDVPADAILPDSACMRGGRAFTWNDRRFPDPAALVRGLRRDGLRVVARVDPGVKVDLDYSVYREGLERGFFCTTEGGSIHTQRAGPGATALPDFNRADVRRWWCEQHAPLLDAGVAGIWNDMNEPGGWRADVRLGRAIRPILAQDMSTVVQRSARQRENGTDAAGTDRVAQLEVRNLYASQECRATRAALERGRPGERPFVLTRSGYAGIQRDAGVRIAHLAARWSDLRASIPAILGLSLSGVGFCGADIGGSRGICTPELFARWIQIGALYPLAVSHSTSRARRHEPWSFGPRVEAIARAALELRMSLLPYLYGLFRRCEETGEPPWRPLFHDFPDDPACARIDDQVMLGPDLLVAPVLRRGERERDVVLPPGVWWDRATGARLAGGRTIRVPAPLDALPLFVRGGTVLPTASPVRHTGETPREPLVLEVYPGRDGHAVLYEDDGFSSAYRDEGRSSTSDLRLRDRTSGRLRLEIGHREGRYEIAPRPLRISIAGCPRPQVVLADGARLEDTDRLPGYRAQGGRVDVRVLDRGESRSIEVDPAP